MFKRTILLIFLAIIVFTQTTLASEGTTGAQFLTWGIGARASGMGEAFCAVADDATAIHFNPAGLGFLRKPAFVGMHSDLYADLDAATGMSHSFLGYTQPVGENTFGLGLNYLNTGEHTLTNEKGDITGSCDIYDLSAILSLAHPFSDNLSVGINLKYIYSDYYAFKGRAYAGSFGLLYKTPLKGLNLGAAIENIGSKIYYKDDWQADELPANVKIGAAYNFPLGDKARILLAIDLNQPLYDDFIDYNTGAELGLFKLLSLRVGYFDKGAGWKDYTYGFGANYKGFNLDFANVPGGDLGRNNRISLGIRF
ncbi:PorV/PorQ family protein [bacterium]|nr:PorV/PorQ family protein [bacterium]